MGYEYITQPQVFLAPISATNGIVGMIENYPLLTQYGSWTVTTTEPTSSFPVPLSGGIIADTPEQFIVNVGGVVQAPTKYTVDNITKTINFSIPVPDGIEVSFTQLATHAPSSNQVENLLATNKVVTNTIEAVNGDITELVCINLSSDLCNVNSLKTQTLEISSESTQFGTTSSSLEFMDNVLSVIVNGQTFYIPLLSAI
jgi:hypothetical protein